MDVQPQVEFHYQVQKPVLVLYYYPECPYCQRVLGEIRKLGVSVELRNTNKTPAYREELITKGGKTQVPCLFINGKPLYESQKIISYLQSIR